MSNFAVPFLRETRGTILVLNFLLGKSLESFRNSYYGIKSAEDGYFKRLRETEKNIFVSTVYTVKSGILEE